MLRRTFFLHAGAVSAFLVLVLGCSGGGSEVGGPLGPTNDPAHLDAPYVILVSFDGFRHDYLEMYPTPAFDRVAAAGVRAEAMKPTFPTKTFPTHYSIATGMYAENHGLVGNQFWDPDRGEAYSMGDRSAVEDGTWYGGEPLWVTAETQGMVAASYFFVGSEAAVGGVTPSYWYRYDGSIPNNDRVDQVIDWLKFPAESRPHMITLYFSDVDNAGHSYGPGSPEVGAAVAAVDGSLGRLLDRLSELDHEEDVYVVVVSDHGMLAATADGADPVDPTLFPGVSFVTMGTYASIFVDDDTPGRAEQVRDSLQAMLPGHGVYLRADVPERLHYSSNPRVGDIVIVAPSGRTVVTPSSIPENTYYTHGWDNDFPEMWGVFLAQGSRISSGQTIDMFEAVHVYPMITHLLGLEANPEADGRLEVLLPVVGG